MSEDILLIRREGAVAHLTLNRPSSGNAIDVPLARALMEASIQLDEDDGVRCVVITGAGRMFCAGGDIASFAAAGDNFAALTKEITSYLHVAVARFARMLKPLVTVVNGPAAGAGLPLAALGDIAIAARSAHFTLAYSAIGLTPDGGATYLLPRLVGMRRAQELALLNKRLNADEAAAIGLITRVVDDAALAAEANAIAQQLAAAQPVRSGARASFCCKVTARAWKRRWSGKRGPSPKPRARSTAAMASPLSSPSRSQSSNRAIAPQSVRAIKTFMISFEPP